jgi:hypothetical protein
VAGMGLMGLGGLLAIIGGLLFVVVCCAPCAPARDPGMMGAMKAIQTCCSGCFMRVEAVFNRAFGDRINPYYHLGSITFFLFWIVAGSGLYLYAFFETGVPRPTLGEALTHNQWFAGGIMRSVHRYASDAMVLTMVLHMLRYFAFNLYHGFRWFSWVTGVALIWMVYASGINGYMLPWDQLAQYVTVTSFEWLDWLPIFNGTLMRNFLYSDMWATASSRCCPSCTWACRWWC